MNQKLVNYGLNYFMLLCKDKKSANLLYHLSNAWNFDMVPFQHSVSHGKTTKAVQKSVSELLSTTPHWDGKTVIL